jgi:hypothetical protein
MLHQNEKHVICSTLVKSTRIEHLRVDFNIRPGKNYRYSYHLVDISQIAYLPPRKIAHGAYQY